MTTRRAVSAVATAVATRRILRTGLLARPLWLWQISASALAAGPYGGVHAELVLEERGGLSAHRVGIHGGHQIQPEHLLPARLAHQLGIPDPGEFAHRREYGGGARVRSVVRAASCRWGLPGRSGLGSR